MKGSPGFSNQTRELCKRLSKDPEFEIVHLGHNYIGKNLKKVTCEDDEEYNFRILTGTPVPYTQNALPQYLFNEKPDIFFILLDTFMLYPWIFNLPVSCKSVMYYPSDGERFPKNCENVLRKFTNPIAMAKFGQAQIKNTFNIDSDHIPHAVSTDDFFPQSPQRKAELKARFNIPPNAFVFGDVARNQGRKNMPATIIAFKKFMDLNPDNNAYLFLHTDVNDVAAHSNLAELAKTYGVLDRVRFSGMNFFSGFTHKDMNDIYNVMDVRISTTTGEGFGICTIESLACEVPNIITDYTTTPELLGYEMPRWDNNLKKFDWINRKDEEMVGKFGLGARVASEVVGTWDVLRGFVDTDNFAQKMTVLYKDEKLRKEMGKNGRIEVRSKYDWDRTVYPMWKQKFKEIVKC